MALRTPSRLRSVLKKIRRPQTGWLDLFPAVIGQADGTISTGTPGIIYVRNVLNGQIFEVHNTVAPNIFMLQVEVGRRVEEPNLWQVKGLREAFASPAAEGHVVYHSAQHTFPAGDTVWVDRKQIMPLTILVSDAAAFVVTVYGATIITASGVALIDTQTVDLSTYIPTTGALYVGIETDATGTLSVHSGTGIDAPELATAADVPVPAAGSYLLGFVLLTQDMTELLDEHIRVLMPFASVALNTDTEIHAATAVTILEDADEFGFWNSLTSALGKITWANIKAALQAVFDLLYAPLTHTHAVNIMALQGLERWNGASGQDTFDLVDVAQGVSSVLVNGVEVDPLIYTLSADGTQIVLDDPLPADALVTAHTYLEIL